MTMVIRLMYPQDMYNIYLPHCFPPANNAGHRVDICRNRRKRKYFPGGVIFSENTTKIMFFLSNLGTCVISLKV